MRKLFFVPMYARLSVFRPLPDRGKKQGKQNHRLGGNLRTEIKGIKRGVRRELSKNFI